MRTLQDILDDLSFEDLPPSWLDHDLVRYSPTKKLWDYQQEALQYALKALWKYYENLQDYQEREGDSANQKRKEELWKWYSDNCNFDEESEANLDISIETQRRDVRSLLEAYYPVQDGRIDYSHFINRMSFWMATGSGKSLVLIKLIEILWRLMQRREIPKQPVLVLTARDDLLEQLKRHVDEFNEGRTDFHILLEDLKSYPERTHSLLPIIGEREMTVFYYRADNLSDEQKQRLLDFRNYENGGRWYILLDEAHKGDKEDSKRQHIYSILSRNGFLFNFSATFTDERDILTTVYNFNLAEFVRAGYGKHITILKQENRAFKDKEDYTGAEKQRVVLKSLLMLAYTRKAKDSLPVEAYHRPLLLVLVNSVDEQNADLECFFRELERIGQGDVDNQVWEKARRELWDELSNGVEWLFEDQRFSPDKTLFDSIDLKTLLELVYNANAPGQIEVLLRPSNRKEMAFKLKNADQPFALIKIGDISGWLKTKLTGYEVVEGFEDEGFFSRLNDEGSPINILMGSRSFYEGWDSNRPNVITYINIGTGTEAKKFILQSVGRGVRIEPLPGMRKRLQSLYNARQVDEQTYRSLKTHANALETLFIFGTNRDALQKVIEHLEQEKRKEGEHVLELEENWEVVQERCLLIPVYRAAEHVILKERNPRKFEISQEELDQLKEYVAYLNDPRLLICHHGASVSDVDLLSKCLENPTKYFNTNGDPRYGRIEVLLSRLFAYFKVVPQRFGEFKRLKEEIRHFKHIKVFLKDINELKRKIDQVLQAPQRIAEVKERYESKQLCFDEMVQQIQSIRSDESFNPNGQTLHIKRVAQHYYLPLLLAESERIDWIRHVIRHQSEIDFLKSLEEYLQQPDNAFKQLDWWAFSKIDESLDEVYIPYYDPQSNRVRRFLPDFIFWLQKGDRYAIVFVDPKGMKQTDYQYKIDGYQSIFYDECGKPRELDYNGLKVRVYLLLFTEDANRAPAAYKEHWFDRPEAIANCLLG